MISPAAQVRHRVMAWGRSLWRMARQWGAAIVVVFARRLGHRREDQQTIRARCASGLSGTAMGQRPAGVFRVCKAEEARLCAAHGDGFMLCKQGLALCDTLRKLRPVCREAVCHRRVFRPHRKAALRLRILERNTTHHTCINLYVRHEKTTGAKGSFCRASLLLGPAGMAGGDALGGVCLWACWRLGQTFEKGRGAGNVQIGRAHV